MLPFALAAGVVLLAMSIMIVIGQRRHLVATTIFEIYGAGTSIGYTTACLIVFIAGLVLTVGSLS